MYGNCPITVVLSGIMQDGMRGAQVIHDMGGQTIVQDPTDAEYICMPKSVILHDHLEEILSAENLGQWPAELIGKHA